MGTRADFYVGVGKDAEWLGSIAFDGHPDGAPTESGAVIAVTEEAFREAVIKLAKQDDFTSSEQGWPWPWDDSGATDYSYWFTGNHVDIYSFGMSLTKKGRRGEFPNMRARKNVTMGKRSGLIVLTSRR